MNVWLLRWRIHVQDYLSMLLLPLNRRLGCLEDGHHRLGNLRTDPIPGKQGGRDLLVGRGKRADGFLRGRSRLLLWPYSSAQWR